ncbi:MAG: GTP-binding protein [Terriglobales bacterium]|jgi:Ni2+-binding GTPase involved in maturation of urease and hydrogenase
MKLVICAGPPTCGKTTVLRQVARRLLAKQLKVSFLKIDVQYADEDEILQREFAIPTRKVYSGELCPDHCTVMVLGDALQWAEQSGADLLMVETAGLCLRCSPYVEGLLGIVVLEATSGMNLPRKIGPMLSLADVAVVTKIDLVSQAEREVFRARIQEAAPSTAIVESNALYGIGIEPLVRRIERAAEVAPPLFLRGNPPIGTCTICIGKKEIGWQSHFGVVRALENQNFYRGE